MTDLIGRLTGAIDAEPHPDRRAALEELSLSLLWLGIVRWDIAQMRAVRCRRTLDARRAGGDDDQRDVAAA